MSIIQSFVDFVKSEASVETAAFVKQRTESLWIANFDEFAQWVEQALDALLSDKELFDQLQRCAQEYVDLYEDDDKRLAVLHENDDQVFLYYDEREEAGQKIYIHLMWRGVHGKTVSFSHMTNKKGQTKASKALLWRLAYWLVQAHIPAGLAECVDRASHHL